MADLYITAIHEAGHAVAAIVLDLPFTTVQIGLTGAELGGVTQFGFEWCDERGPAFERRAAAQVVMALAGPAAEERHTGDNPDAGAGSDYATAVYFADMIAEEPDEHAACLERCRAEAKTLVNCNWDKIERLASTLVSRKLLTRDEVIACAAHGGASDG